jgi:hypothetical protein
VGGIIGMGERRKMSWGIWGMIIRGLDLCSKNMRVVELSELHGELLSSFEHCCHF